LSWLSEKWRITTMVSTKTTVFAVIGAIFVTAMLIGGSVFFANGGSFSTVDKDATDKPSADTSVTAKFNTKDYYTGSDISDATIKLYKNQPAQWNSFDSSFVDAINYDIETTVSGKASFDALQGTYFAVVEKSGYYKLFDKYDNTIEDNPSQIEISQYNTNKAYKPIKMSPIGAFDGTDFVVTATDLGDNESNKIISVNEDIKVDSKKTVIVGKVLFTPTAILTNDSDANSVSNIGIKSITITIAGKSMSYNPMGSDTKAEMWLIPEDTTERASFDYSKVTFLEKTNVPIDVEIKADVNTVSAINKLTDGAGLIGTITVFDVEGTNVDSTTITI
jgi:hypothetical protein